MDIVIDEKDELHSQFTASEPVVQQLANLAAKSTLPLSIELLLLLQHLPPTAAKVSTKHTVSEQQ